MSYVLYSVITIIACTIGAISGIGGGIIIKPSFDAFTTLSVPVITFLSCCASFTLATFSMIRCDKKILRKNLKVNIFLAIGAVIGGIIGKGIFEILISTLKNDKMVGLIAAICIFIITLIIFINRIFFKDCKTYNFKNPAFIILIGCTLGIVSSFLGIGGGPLNIILVYLVFSASPKTSAIMSLFVIMFSQGATLISTAITGNIPTFNIMILLVIIVSAIVGAIIGKKIFTKMTEQTNAVFFKYVLLLIMAINIYNIIKFSL
ncbi:MAG: sulfite exporter TauE/SafE family protein [Clostridia bacterium]